MNLTPKQTVAYLDEYIIGQFNAKKSIAIALRNRYRRLKLEGEMAEEIMKKNGDKKGARINDVGYLRKRILFTAMDKGFVPPHGTEEVGDTGDEER